MKIRHAIVPSYLAACLVFGGASAGGYIANLLLQLAALPLIVWALIERPLWPLPRSSKQLLWLLTLLSLLFVLQLAPLPPGVWTRLPGRAWIALDLDVLGVRLPWLPISLAPDRTTADFVWLLPAIAVLLAMLRLGAFQERWIAWTVLGVAIASVLVGAAQVRAGASSPWYFYQITNWGQAVGFFANSNHEATLLVATLPFVASLAPTGQAELAHRPGARGPGATIILGCIALIVLVGLALNSSLAGAGLTLPAFGMSLLLFRKEDRLVPRWLIIGIGAVTLCGIGAIMVGPFGNNLTGSGAKSQISRKTSFSQSLEVGSAYFPFGSGLGSFQSIYHTAEDPHAVTDTYMNHAHSDVIEIYLEAGAFALVLIVLFLMWWARETTTLWRRVDALRSARAATIVTAVIMAHSLVDYPLRTAAISSLFACCCALILGARPAGDMGAPVRRPARHISAS